MIKSDRYYKKNLKKILQQGHYDENPRPKYPDGTPAYSKFITQVYEEYDLRKKEYPITTLRNTAIKTGIKEILWIYQKQSNKIQEANEMGILWWNDWDIGDGTIGQRYGATVKSYKLMDELLLSLKLNPFSRRHILNLYQESDLRQTNGLYPCAYETIWSVRKIKKEYFLDLTLIQRSNDYIMAGYINKIQYVGLQLMVAGHLNYKPGKFVHFVQNLHVYDRHFDALHELMEKKPLNKQPMILLKTEKHFYDYTIDDFIIVNTEDITKIESKLELAI